MPNILIRSVPIELFNKLKKTAKKKERSPEDELISILSRALSNRNDRLLLNSTDVVKSKLVPGWRAKYQGEISKVEFEPPLTELEDFDVDGFIKDAKSHAQEIRRHFERIDGLKLRL